MKSQSAQYIADVIERVTAIAQDYADGLDTEFQGDPYGATAPTKEQTQGFVKLVLQKDPPTWWKFPDGHMEFNSGWVIAMREDCVEGGLAAYRKIERALGGDNGQSV